MENSNVEVDESEDRPNSKLLESRSSQESSQDKADDDVFDDRGMNIAEEKTEEITEWDAGAV